MALLDLEDIMGRRRHRRRKYAVSPEIIENGNHSALGGTWTYDTQTQKYTCADVSGATAAIWRHPELADGLTENLDFGDIIKVEWEITDYTSGDVRFKASENNNKRGADGNTASLESIFGPVFTVTDRSAVGVYEETQMILGQALVPTQYVNIRIQGNNGFNGSCRLHSCKRIYRQPWGAQVVPQPSLNSTDDWTKEAPWIENSGKFEVDGTQVGVVNAYADLTETIVSGQTYWVQVELNTYVAGNCDVSIGGGTAQTLTTNGHWLFKLTAGGSNQRINLAADADGDFHIASVWARRII